MFWRLLLFGGTITGAHLQTSDRMVHQKTPLILLINRGVLPIKDTSEHDENSYILSELYSSVMKRRMGSFFGVLSLRLSNSRVLHTVI